MQPHDPLVSVEWLAEKIDNPSVLVLDATWNMPGDDDPHPGNFIDGGRFDIDKVADTSSGLAHTLPSEAFFQNEVRSLGVNDDTHVICYDRHGMFSAPRAWWMFRAMGHDKVNVLDGGLPAWIAAGHSTSATYREMPTGDFTAKLKPNLYKVTDDIHAALNTKQILDARPKGRFDGSAPEPRAGLSSGHMPGATSVPFSELKTADGFLKTKKQLEEMFAARHIDLDAPIITSCGSGITACAIVISLARVGAWDAAVYDGSWTEWASTDGCPIEKVGQ